MPFSGKGRPPRDPPKVHFAPEVHHPDMSEFRRKKHTFLKVHPAKVHFAPGVHFTSVGKKRSFLNVHVAPEVHFTCTQK